MAALRASAKYKRSVGPLDVFEVSTKETGVLVHFGRYESDKELLTTTLEVRKDGEIYRHPFLSDDELRADCEGDDPALTMLNLALLLYAEKMKGKHCD